MRILVLFTRDLRVHDHPALDAAVHDADQVLPLFVADPALLAISPNRARFLTDAIDDLDTSLSDRGARLLIRSGDPAVVAPWKAARRRCDAIYLTDDVTPRARRRIDAMRRACEPAGIEVRTFPGHAVVEPGMVTPAGRPAYRVFTPYLHAWLAAPRRPVLGRPPLITSIPYLHPGRMPARDRLPAGAPRLPRGGESTGRRLMQRFLQRASEATRKDGTGSMPTRHRVSRRTCGSGASPQPNWPIGPSITPTPTRSFASWPGETSSSSWSPPTPR